MASTVPALWRDFMVQRRVVGGIMLREILSRWGRRNLGFAWLFCEPLVFAFPVIAVWSYVRSPYEHGVPITVFVWTGYMPILIFRHVTGGAINSIRGSAALLYHSLVTPLDIFLGRQGLESLGNLASVAFSFFVLYTIGAIDWPFDYSIMLLGFLYTTWWSLSIALILAALSERTEYVLHIWAPIGYLYIFFSGFFWMADWLPPRILNIAMWIDPPLHCYEMVRAGMFGNLMRPHYDVPYLTLFLSVLTLIGLCFIHNVRNHLEIE
jgi:capsular polysaccharide transport system permease protein